jgi:hypothetical protein
MVWGGGDAWRTGGRYFAGVWQRRLLARAQAPRRAAPRRRGLGTTVVFGYRRGRACVYMCGCRCNQAIRPFAWSGALCWCVCEHACFCGRVYALECFLLPLQYPISTSSAYYHSKAWPESHKHAMVSQAMVHPFPRPPSLRVVSYPVSRLASVSSRCAITGIRPSIHPGQRLLIVIKARYLRRG